MDAVLTFALYSLVLLLVSMAGAFLPRIKELNDRQAHLLMALSAGIFIGLLFFLLLPEAIHESEHGGFDVHVVMYAIAAVVLGGAKLTGGVGKVSGSFIGTLIMSSFSNIFSMQNVLDAVWSDVVVGAVLLIVIMVQAMVTLRGGGKKKT